VDLESSALPQLRMRPPRLEPQGEPESERQVEHEQRLVGGDPKFLEVLQRRGGWPPTTCRS
jgi:hypothetical protein